MKKKEIKREKKEKETFRRLREIVKRFDSYEEIYPEREIEENQRLDEKTISELKVIAESLSGTSVEKYICALIDIENKIKEKDMLYEEEIIKALYIKDRLYLLSHEETENEHELKKDIWTLFYKRKRTSLMTALSKNIRTICSTDNHKRRMQALRNRNKLIIYLNVIDSSINSQEANKENETEEYKH